MAVMVGRAARLAAHAWPLLVLVAVLTGWMLLWAVTNPITAAPDEPSHFVKAVAAGRGDLTGRPVPHAVIVRMHAFRPQSLSQVERSFRYFDLPAPLRTSRIQPCTEFRRFQTADCLDSPAHPIPARFASIAGAYPPWLYIPGGMLARFGSSAWSAYVLARLATAALCGTLVAATAFLLLGGWAGHTARLWAIAGLACALTPMSIFLSAEVGASGPEIFGAVAAFAAALRLSRNDEPTRAVWVVAGVAMMLAALSRPLAPVWLALAAAVAVLRLGPRPAWHRLIAGGCTARWSLAEVILGVLTNVLWTQAAGLRTPVVWNRFGLGLHAAYHDLPMAIRQAIAVFGWQDTAVPSAVYMAWLTLIAALFITGLALAEQRTRILLLLIVPVLFVAYEVEAAAVFEQNGFGMQGRYILPALVLLPLLAGEASAQGSARHPSGASGLRFGSGACRFLLTAPAGIVAATAVLQALAWYTNARRYAVGAAGPEWFLRHAQWAPPGGWPCWFAIAGLLTAAGLTVAGGARSSATGYPWPTRR